jgi:hypothetical protein
VSFLSTKFTHTRSIYCHKSVDLNRLNKNCGTAFSENLIKEPVGKDFYICARNFSHILCFKARYGPALLNKEKGGYSGSRQGKDDGYFELEE